MHPPASATAELSLCLFRCRAFVLFQQLLEGIGLLRPLFLLLLRAKWRRLKRKGRFPFLEDLGVHHYGKPHVDRLGHRCANYAGRFGIFKRHCGNHTGIIIDDFNVAFFTLAHPLDEPEWVKIVALAGVFSCSWSIRYP